MRDILVEFTREFIQSETLGKKMDYIQKRYLKENRVPLVDLSLYLTRELKILLKAYQKVYSAPIHILKNEIVVTANDSKSLSHYLGHGSTTVVYRLEIGRKSCAIILDEFGNVNSSTSCDDIYAFFRKLMALILSKKLKNVPQILGYSLKERMLVTTVMLGISLAKKDANFTTKQLIELIKTVIQLNKRGLCIDYYPDNLLFHRKTGFSVVDLCLQKDDTSLIREIMSLRFMLCFAGPNKERRRQKSLRIGLKILKTIKKYFPEVLKKIQQSDQDEILIIGDKNLFCEYDPANADDVEYLRKAQKIITNTRLNKYTCR